MRSRDVDSNVAVEYERLLNLLGSTLKYLEGLSVDPHLLGSYKQMLRHLRSKRGAAISEILGYTVEGASATDKLTLPRLKDDEILAMTVEQILNKASDPKTSRKHLEQIASVRFGMTKGGLSVLRNRDALVEKLRTLILNESAHDSIARVAGKRGPGK